MSDITFEYVTDPGDSITFELTDKVTLPPGGGGGTSDHRDLTNRSSADQHPTSAITGLDAALAGKETAGAAATAQAYAVQRANHTGTQSADSLTDGTTNKAYTAAEQTKLAAITGTNTGDQTLPTLSSLGAVPTSRTLAGLDLSADRNAAALRAALGLWTPIANETLGSASGSRTYDITGYRFVRITVAARSNRTGSIDSIRLRFNGDTGSNYSTNAAAFITSISAFDIAGENINTDRSGYVVIQFGYMAGSWLTGTVMGTGPSSTATTAANSLSNGFAWKGATSAAPTSIEVYTTLGQFVAGSSFLVEGRT